MNSKYSKTTGNSTIQSISINNPTAAAYDTIDKNAADVYDGTQGYTDRTLTENSYHNYYSSGTGGGTGSVVDYFYFSITSLEVALTAGEGTIAFMTSVKNLTTSNFSLKFSGASFLTITKITVKNTSSTANLYSGTISFTYIENTEISNRTCTITCLKGKSNKCIVNQTAKTLSLAIDLNDKRSYYNSKFIYYNTGYHDGETYRFGIVYIRKDNSLTLVYDILGTNVVPETRPSLVFPDDMSDYLDGSDNIYWDGTTTPTNKTIFDNTYSDKKYNIKGICRFKNCIKQLTDVIGVKFTFPDDFYDKLKDNYKGFFFVRQKRIPTMLALGYATNICEDSYVPSINVPSTTSTSVGYGQKFYLYESFVSGAFRYQILDSLVDTFYPVKICSKAKSTHKLLRNYRSRLFSLSDYTYQYLDRIVGYGPMSSFLALADSDFSKDNICPKMEMNFTHTVRGEGINPYDEIYYAVAYRTAEKDSWGALTDKSNEDEIMILRILKLISTSLEGYTEKVNGNQCGDDNNEATYKHHKDWYDTPNGKSDCNDGWYGKATTSGKLTLYRNRDKGNYLNRESIVMTRDADNWGLGYKILEKSGSYYWGIDGQVYKDYCGVYAHDNGSTNADFDELYQGVQSYIEKYEAGEDVESELIKDSTSPTFDGKYAAQSDKKIGIEGKDGSRIFMHPMELGAFGVYCPEFELNLPKYNALFTGQSFKVKPITNFLYLTADKNKNVKKRHFTYDNTTVYYKDKKLLEGDYFNVIAVADSVSLLSNLGASTISGHLNTSNGQIVGLGVTGVDSGVSFHQNYGKFYFSSKIGDASLISFKYAGGKYVCYVYPDKTNIDNVHVGRLMTNAPFNILRGAYGPYLGVSIEKTETLDWNDPNTNLADTIVQVMIPGYDEDNMGNYFSIRKEDTSYYQAIGDRISLSKYYHYINGESAYANLVTCYRGDCYINWFTHRINRNFNDATAPYNDTILDVSSFSNSFSACYDSEYRTFDLTKDAEAAGKFNIGDLNAIELGSWVTFPIRSTMNTALRSIDNSFTTEKLACGHGRTFYPRGSLDAGGNCKIVESEAFNSGYDKSGSEKLYLNLNNNIFTSTYFKNRILYSNVLQHGTITNGHRTFLSTHKKDYTDLYGEIVKILELKGNLVVVCEHGILLIPVNERALAGEGAGGNVFINTSNVLPENPEIISSMYGSKFAESVIKTPNGIYGVDESSKKIWKTDGASFQIISDFKIQKFLNDHLNLDGEYITLKQIKTHYNAFKNDVIFTLYDITPYYEDDENTKTYETPTPDELWSICWNENLAASSNGSGWITYYSWIPLISNNIGNCFITTNLMEYNYDENYNRPISYLWKHGKSERITSSDRIKPTSWYGEQHPFEFEFVVNKYPSELKMFDNLQIISNKAKPESFHFEIVGLSYEFAEDKQTAYIRLELTKKFMSKIAGSSISYDEDIDDLMAVYQAKSVIFPMYYYRQDIKNLIYDNYKHLNSVRNSNYDYDALSGTEVLSYPEFNEFRLCNHVKAVDVEAPGGLLRGNMRYLEEKWRVQITPINLLKNNEYYMDNGKKVYGWKNDKVPIVIPNIKVNDATTSQFTVSKLLEVFPDYSIDNISQWNIARREEARVRDKYMKVKIRYKGDELVTIMAVNTLYTISYA